MVGVGDWVIHPFHGEGVITSMSPDKKYAVVKYQDAQYNTYLRTTEVSRLKKA